MTERTNIVPEAVSFYPPLAPPSLKNMAHAARVSCSEHDQ